MKWLNILIGAVALIILLTSCGGGGGGVVVKPPAPENLKAERNWVKSGSNLTQKTDLSWDAVSGAQSYKIYRKAENQNSVTFLKSLSSTSYTDNIPSDLYIFDIDYFVSAIVNGTEGDKAKVTTSAPPPPPPFD
ncbi:hypothetical protein H5T87_04630 [bacterium]|nr:hypothetical protein [bacterium]